MRTCSLKFFLLFTGVVAFVGCSDDNIPQTPQAPFSISDMWILNSTNPRPGNVLTIGQSVSINYGAAYTLSEQDAAKLANLSVTFDFDIIDAQGNFIQEVGDVPDNLININEAGGSVTATKSLAIPAEATNTNFLRLVALVRSTADTLMGDVRFWSLQ